MSDIDSECLFHRIPELWIFKVLPKLKIAHVIGKAVWNQGGDIRDVISIGKLVRKNDGPEEVEQILSTMIKYGEIKKH
jgi:hypothetical protein